MLVSFYKDFESEKASVSVIKFADRIWVNEEGDIECHREIYFELKDGNLKKCLILTPFKNILELEDITKTLLDENYVLNKKSSGEYKLIDKANRFFAMDYIENIYAVPIKIIQSVNIGTCSYIEISFDHEIKIAQKCAFRFKFRINSMAEKLGEDSFHLKLSYFDGRSCKNECTALNIHKREIKAATILDTNRSGGFDILIHLPAGAKPTDTSEYCHKGESPVSPSGLEDKKRVQCIWHMRELYNDEVGREIGVNNGHPFFVTYSMRSLTERVDELRKEIENIKQGNQHLRKDLKKTARGQYIGTILAIIAIIFTIIGIIITFYKKI